MAPAMLAARTATVARGAALRTQAPRQARSVAQRRVVAMAVSSPSYGCLILNSNPWSRPPRSSSAVRATG